MQVNLSPGTYQDWISTHGGADGGADGDVESKESQRGRISRVTLMGSANIVPVDMILVLSNLVVKIKTLVRGQNSIL